MCVITHCQLSLCLVLFILCFSYFSGQQTQALFVPVCLGIVCIFILCWPKYSTRIFSAVNKSKTSPPLRSQCFQMSSVAFECNKTSKPQVLEKTEDRYNLHSSILPLSSPKHFSSTTTILSIFRFKRTH